MGYAVPMEGTTWKRRQGEWCIYGPADLIQQDTTVTVTTKAGRTSKEYIAEVHRAAALNGIKMAYGLPGIPALTQAEAEEIDRATRTLAEQKAASGCQYSVFCAHGCRDETTHATHAAADRAALLRPVAGMCEACGARRATRTVTDHNRMTGRVCTSCASDPDLTIH